MDYEPKDASTLGKVDCLRPQPPAPKKPVNYDDLKQGEPFILKDNCPACDSPVLGIKEQDFQCSKCFLSFTFKKK